MKLFLAGAALLSCVLGADVLTSLGLTNCIDGPEIELTHTNITFDRDIATVTFDISGSSEKQQKVKANVTVSAYGQQVFQKSFDPCDNSTFVRQLCPVPQGSFAARGQQQIPAEYLSKVPAIAFTIPDIEASAEIHLLSAENGNEVACMRSGVSNGKSIDSSALRTTAGVFIGASLLLTGLGALTSAGLVGASSPAPSFTMVFAWFQSMAMDGMLSVEYPPIYRSFTKTFGFTAGLVTYLPIQTAVTDFREATGGNVDRSGSSHRATTANFEVQDARRSLSWRHQYQTRDLTNFANAMPSNASSSKSRDFVSGIENYVELLSIPEANTFMTVLMVLAIVVAAIIVAILGFKLLLEAWALCGSFPKRLAGFRKRYWRVLANTITMLIMLLYGVWTIWCIFQWTIGDSWAAKILAAVTWTLFTTALLFYTIKIFLAVRKFKRQGSDTSMLYEDQDTWHKYSFMYDSYKRQYWWMFLPTIIYMFSKGVVIAAGNGHGEIQTIAQLVIEVVMFACVLWMRPFATKGSNWINNIIQLVRVLSLVCILVFVERLGLSQSTKTVTGVILIATQSSLTLLLGILLAINAIRVCVVTNPHAKRRKEAEAEQRRREQQLESGHGHGHDTPKITAQYIKTKDFGGSGSSSRDRSLSRSSSLKKTPVMIATRATVPPPVPAIVPTSASAPVVAADPFAHLARGASREADARLDRRLSRQPTLPVLLLGRG